MPKPPVPHLIPSPNKIALLSPATRLQLIEAIGLLTEDCTSSYAALQSVKLIRYLVQSSIGVPQGHTNCVLILPRALANPKTVLGSRILESIATNSILAPLLLNMFE